MTSPTGRWTSITSRISSLLYDWFSLMMIMLLFCLSVFNVGCYNWNGKLGKNDIKFEVGRWKCGIDMHLPYIYNINCVEISKHIYTLSHGKASRFESMVTRLCYCHTSRFQFTWTMDSWLIVYIKAPYLHRLCIVASNQIVQENRETKKNEFRANLCIHLYQWWDHSQLKWKWSF